MVRLPAGFHPQAWRGGDRFSYRPGWRGTGMQPIRRVPMQAYTRTASGVTLTGGQVQGQVPAGGMLTLSVGPQGLGNVWYPAQATISTTTGPLDTSTCKVWLGSQGVPVTLVAQVFTGNGTVALAIPSMTPGQVLIFQWTAAKPGDTAGANIIGTMDALRTG
jgi:hypothetical protein